MATVFALIVYNIFLQPYNHDKSIFNVNESLNRVRFVQFEQQVTSLNVSNHLPSSSLLSLVLK